MDPHQPTGATGASGGNARSRRNPPSDPRRFFYFWGGSRGKIRFSSVAAEDLQKSKGVPVTPFIGGVPGYDSGQALQTLRRVGESLKPGWVVIGSLWSDVFRNDDARRFANQQALRGPFRSLATWRILRWWLAPWLSSQKVKWVDSKVDIGTLDDEGHPPRTLLPQYLSHLRAMVSTARSLGAEPVFLVLPAPMDFDKVAPPETVMTYRAAMRSVAAEAQAPLLDGPALFLEKASPKDFLDQVHPSRSGHALLGHALATLLEAQPLPKQAANPSL